MAERRKRTSFYVGPRDFVEPDRLPALEASGDWLFEEKWNGYWCLVVVDGGKIVDMQSRVGLQHAPADTDGLLRASFGGVGSGMLAAELVADLSADGERTGMRRLYVFDVIEWNQIPLRDLPQTERRKALELVFSSAFLAPRERVFLVEQREQGIAEWFAEIIGRGGEGIVAKRKDARYRRQTSDGKTRAWVRSKKQNTVDMVVLSHGKAKGGTPNVELGLYKTLPKKDRQLPSGESKLVRVQTCILPARFWKMGSLVGQVMEIVGFEIFPSGVIRHGQIVRLRPDKRAEDCVFTSTKPGWWKEIER